MKIYTYIYMYAEMHIYIYIYICVRLGPIMIHKAAQEVHAGILGLFSEMLGRLAATSICSLMFADKYRYHHRQIHAVVLWYRCSHTGSDSMINHDVTYDKTVCCSGHSPHVFIAHW